jgi:DNA-binding NarL/FixJ family response regulator
MAEGRTNRGIARRLWLTGRAVETHVISILAKLGLGADEEDHRRVLAVLSPSSTTAAARSRDHRDSDAAIDAAMNRAG